jgi:SAM-dependent methyltransferase
MSEGQVKQQVREFYDQVGWQLAGQGIYQNARYEDLRPVSREYIHRCHLRVNRHLQPAGRFLLDAGSGPVQYPEYLTYSQGYDYRVCADISIVALQEARKRLGLRGLYVVADVANLPFKPGAFDGEVSLHTLHHLPLPEQKKAYGELFRVLAAGRSAVIVNGWTVSPLMNRFQPLVRLMERLGTWISRRRGKTTTPSKPAGTERSQKPTGTYVEKFDAGWLRKNLNGVMDFRVLVWRSVSVRFLRAVIHAPLAGRYWLRLLYALEERYPGYFGENGQYPLIVIRKP